MNQSQAAQQPYVMLAYFSASNIVLSIIMQRGINQSCALQFLWQQLTPALQPDCRPIFAILKSATKWSWLALQNLW